MTDNVNKLLQLVVSRMSHDLINPASAINNGLELLALTGDASADSEEISLIASSAKKISQQIQFFSLAFGSVKTDQQINSANLSEMVQDCMSDARTDIDWQVETFLSAKEAKLILLLVMCLRSAAPRGGVIKVSSNSENLQLDLTGETIIVENSEWVRLSGQNANTALSPALVQFDLAYLFITEVGCVLDIQESDDMLRIEFEKLPS